MNKFTWVNIAGVSLHLPDNLIVSSIRIKNNLFRVKFSRTEPNKEYLRYTITGFGCNDFQEKLLAFAQMVQLLNY